MSNTIKLTSPSGKINTLYRQMSTENHLLIAGATGSGKSVLVNALMYTLLYRFPFNSDGGAEFILIDPKRVELVQYKDLPHTIRYDSEPEGMLDALQEAMEEIDRRYEEMQEQRLKKYPGSDIYVIIDELADLMTTQKKEVMPLLQRIAQVGRAAKVHLIACTQCPLAEVIPTKIMVNFDARAGLRTRNAQDSRNILGMTGCETLPRYGQCYYMTADGVDRYDLPMYSDEELNERIKWWTDQATNEQFRVRIFSREKELEIKKAMEESKRISEYIQSEFGKPARNRTNSTRRTNTRKGGLLSWLF